MDVSRWPLNMRRGPSPSPRRMPTAFARLGPTSCNVTSRPPAALGKEAGDGPLRTGRARDADEVDGQLGDGGLIDSGEGAVDGSIDVERHVRILVVGVRVRVA